MMPGYPAKHRDVMVDHAREWRCTVCERVSSTLPTQADCPGPPAPVADTPASEPQIQPQQKELWADPFAADRHLDIRATAIHIGKLLEEQLRYVEICATRDESGERLDVRVSTRQGSRLLEKLIEVLTVHDEERNRHIEYLRRVVRQLHATSLAIPKVIVYKDREDKP